MRYREGQHRLDKGWLAYSEPKLQWLRPEYTITRKTYSFAGRTIATLISGNTGNYNQTYAYDPLGNFRSKAGVTMGYGRADGIAANASPTPSPTWAAARSSGTTTTATLRFHSGQA
jgi:hypothetical protein